MTLEHYESEKRGIGDTVAAEKALALRLEHGDVPLEVETETVTLKKFEDVQPFVNLVANRFNADNGLKESRLGESLLPLVETMLKEPAVSYAAFISCFPGLHGCPNTIEIFAFDQNDDAARQALSHAHSQTFATLRSRSDTEVLIDSFLHHYTANADPLQFIQDAKDRNTGVGSRGKLIAIAKFDR